MSTIMWVLSHVIEIEKKMILCSQLEMYRCDELYENTKGQRDTKNFFVLLKKNQHNRKKNHFPHIGNYYIEKHSTVMVKPKQ